MWELKERSAQEILLSVITLKKVFAKMKTQLENKSKEIKKLREDIMKVTEEMERKKTAIQRDRWRHLWTTGGTFTLAKHDRCFHLEEGNSTRTH